MTMIVELTSIPGGGTAAVDNKNSDYTYVIWPSVNLTSDVVAFWAEAPTHVFNYGEILSKSYDAIEFDAGGDLFNGAGATISGHTGISVGGSGFLSVTNFGAVIGADGNGMYVGSGTFSMDNRGYLYGKGHGIADMSKLAGCSIANSSTIQSPGTAILLQTLTGVITDITNSGTIVGGSHSIASNEGRVVLHNGGKLIGDVALSAGADADTIVNSGSITGTVHLGGGNDVFRGNGGTSGPVFGEAGADHLVGGSAGDHLSGGAQSDTLTGGTRNDHFVFDTALATAGVDRITDFRHLTDKIDLSHAIFTATNAAGTLQATMFFEGRHAHDASDRIVYNPVSGWLTYDTNGSAPGGTHHFATLAAHLTLTHGDFLVAP